MSYSRSPGRWLGPLALLAALAAVFVIVNATTRDEEPTQTARQTSTDAKRDGDAKGSSTGEEQASGEEAKTSTTPASGKKTYTVRPGDTLAGIADRTGVSIEEIRQLNPDVDSNSLSIGQELRLAR